MLNGQAPKPALEFDIKESTDVALGWKRIPGEPAKVCIFFPSEAGTVALALPIRTAIGLSQSINVLMRRG